MRLHEIILEAGEPANPSRRNFLKRAAAQVLSTQMPARTLTGLAAQIAQKTVDPVAASWARLLITGLNVYKNNHQGSEDYFTNSQGQLVPMDAVNLPIDKFKEFLDRAKNKDFDHYTILPTVWVRGKNNEPVNSSIPVFSSVSNKGIKFVNFNGFIIYEDPKGIPKELDLGDQAAEELLLPGLEDYHGDFITSDDDEHSKILVDLAVFGPSSVPDSWYQEIIDRYDDFHDDPDEENEVLVKVREILQKRQAARGQPVNKTGTGIVQPGSGFVATQILRAVQSVIDRVIDNALDNQEVAPRPNTTADKHKPQALPAPTAEPDIIDQVLQASAEELGRELSAQEREYVIAKVKNES